MPLFNDVCTDLEDIIQFKKTDIGQMSEQFIQYNKDSYPNLKGLQISMPKDEAFDKVLATAQKQKRWIITENDKEAGHIEGVAKSALFRFTDDFAIRIKSEGEGSMIDMRSKSRLGKSDLGANAKRIKEFFNQLKSS